MIKYFGSNYSLYSKLELTNKENYKYYKYWKISYFNNKNEFHREDGPAVERSDGYKSWLINGKRHREDGPAVISSSYKLWWRDNKLHREDGPAKIYKDGNIEYWYDNYRIFVDSDIEFKMFLKREKLKIFI